MGGKQTRSEAREIVAIGRRGLGVGLLGGVLALLAYPPWGLWPLAFVAYVPLLLWIAKDSPTWRQAVVAGLVQGTVLHLAVYWFLVFTMQAMSGFPWGLAVGVCVIHAGAMGLHQAMFASLAQINLAKPVHLGTPRAIPAPPPPPRFLPMLRQMLLLSAIYAAIEFAVPYLFPWYLGNALYTTRVWIQAADVVGIPGVSLLLMACNVAITQAILHPVARRRALAMLAVLLIGWAGYGALRLQQVESTPARRTFHAAVVQADATLKEKLSDGLARLPMLDRTERMTRDLDLTGVDLVVWPEGALPFFWVVDDVLGDGGKAPTRAPRLLRDVKRRVLRLAKDIDRPILFGTLRRLDPLWLAEARNSAFLLRPGVEPWNYDKRILLPFGEYLPGTGLLPALKESIPGVSHMDPGTTSGLVEVAGTRLLVNICYEALFPAFLREQGSSADIFVNLTNDVWFGPLPAPELHLMVQQARAVELRRPLLRSTVSGITALVDATGLIQGRTELHEQAVRRFDVPLRDLGSPYRLWGDAPMWALTAALLAWGGWRWRQRRAKEG